MPPPETTSLRRCCCVGEIAPGDESIAALTPWAVEFRYGEAPEEQLDRSLTLALLIDLRAWVAGSLD